MDVVEAVHEAIEEASPARAPRVRVKARNRIHLMSMAKRSKIPLPRLNPLTIQQIIPLPHRLTLPSKEAPPRRNARIVEVAIAEQDKARRKVVLVPHKHPLHRKNKIFKFCTWRNISKILVSFKKRPPFNPSFSCGLNGGLSLSSNKSLLKTKHLTTQLTQHFSFSLSLSLECVARVWCV